MTIAPEQERILTREEQAPENCWNLEALYATPEDWDKEFSQIDELLKPILALQGKLTSPAAVAETFKAEDALGRAIERLYSYAHHREDEDTGNSTNQGRSQRIMAKYTEVAAKTAWVRPEILTQSLETLKAWREDEALKPYQRSMDVLVRDKPHTLSNAEETLISTAGEVFRNPYNTFGYLTNADMTFPDVEDEKGKKRPLSQGRYITFLENRDRSVRERAFKTFYDTYIGFENTLASTLAGSVKLDNFNARVRHFDSALEAALHPDNVPVSLYDTLVDSVHEALPKFHKYLELRKQILGVDELNMWDVYVPIVPDFDIKVDWAEACQWVLEACEPLGKEYTDALKTAFTDRWIDVYENKGKRSGAYSGGCYDSFPYVLMNYQGTLDHVFTLAHELGHSMHSLLAHKTQPYRYADYTIFVAEIASTTNEALLLDYLLKKTDDPKFKAYLLNHRCEQFRGTVFRQTMFAEYERMIHEMDASGTPLTAENFSKSYYDLNAKFHGPLIKADDRISHEWSRIPHFYYNFYVYKYATGFCASQVFSQRILNNPEHRDMYLDFLRSGGSADPLDQVKKGGVDLTDRKVMTNAFESFGQSVKELSGLLLG
ncbi:oligoendopeptidase F [bacterium]|nr:oligoendopeptidase F [bacterium]